MWSKQRKFLACRSLVWAGEDFLTLSLAIQGQECGWATTPLNTLSVAREGPDLLLAGSKAAPSTAEERPAATADQALAKM